MLTFLLGEVNKYMENIPEEILWQEESSKDWKIQNVCKEEVEVWPVTIKGIVEYRNKNGNQSQVIERLEIKTKNFS